MKGYMTRFEKETFLILNGWNIYEWSDPVYGVKGFLQDLSAKPSSYRSVDITDFVYDEKLWIRPVSDHNAMNSSIYYYSLDNAYKLYDN